MSVPEARLLLRDLTEHATQPEFVYIHKWTLHDLVMWDNRQTMHRVRRYDQSVLRLALHMLGNEQDAQDVNQEAFLKAYRHLGNFRFECSFYTWLYRIVTNLCLDHLRRRKSRREDPATVIDSRGDEMDLLSNISDTRSMANPARELDRKSMGESINQALDKLTPRERTVFELKHYQGLKLRTIGEMLSTTEETAKNTLFRATRKLRAHLADLKERKA